MKAIINQVSKNLIDYKDGKIELQELVNAIEALRDNAYTTYLDADKIYLDLEVINAVNLDEGRSLSLEEIQQIAYLVEKIQSLLNYGRVSI